MIECKICGKTGWSDWNSLCKHLKSHKINSKQYYDIYLKKGSSDGKCKICGMPTTYRGIHNGYLKYCSPKCAHEDDEYQNKKSKKMKGRKQSDAHIKKRLENTNQLSKEQTRRKTMLEKYGLMYNAASITDERNQKISDSLKGHKKSKEHIEKIIDSKRRNGTLSHSNDTKKQISRSLKEYHQQGNDQSITLSGFGANGRGHMHGYINGVLYRSSYEASFLKKSIEVGIKVVSAENKNFRVRYYDNNDKKHWYYPDFYLPDLDIIVEIKPESMRNYKNNKIKFDTARKYYKEKYVVLCEEELYDIINQKERVEIEYILLGSRCGKMC